MTDGATVPVLLSIPGVALPGEESAMVCEGGFCEVPVHLETRVVTRRLDEDAV